MEVVERRHKKGDNKQFALQNSRGFAESPGEMLMVSWEANSTVVKYWLLGVKIAECHHINWTERLNLAIPNLSLCFKVRCIKCKKYSS